MQGRKFIDETLQKLRRVELSDIDCQEPDVCMDGTRVKLLEDLETWSKDRHTPPIFWLDGMAGTGKSAIARTFCRHLQKVKRLAGSFFCSRRGSADEADANRILPTLAASFAIHNEGYRTDLVSSLEKDPMLMRPNIQVQRDRLFNGIGNVIFPNDLPMIFVIDAIDECSNEKDVHELLLHLIDIFTSSHSIKLLVCARPEQHIQAPLNHEYKNRQVFHLHKIERDLIDEDISHFLCERLKAARLDHEALGIPFPVDWPSSTDLRRLTKLSGGLFIFAATAVIYIQEGPRDRLQEILGYHGPDESDHAKPLDDIYKYILTKAFDKQSKKEKLDTMRILTTLLTLRDRLSIPLVCKLIGGSVDPTRLRTLLSRLHAVVQVPHDDTGVLSTFHASFGDFLTSPDRAKGLYINLSSGHEKLLSSCTDIMTDVLHFDMCKVASSFLRNSEQPLAEIPTLVRYACLNWPYHAVDRPDTPHSIRQFEDAIVSKFLYWLEVLSACRKADLASILIITALKARQRLKFSRRLVLFLQDANSFVVSYREAIESSIPHIYLSAIPSCLASSLMNVSREVAPLVSYIPQLHILEATGQRGVPLVLRGHSAGVNTVAISEDSTLVISGSDDMTIRVWDAKTGRLVMDPLVGHTEWVASIAFSKYDSRIVSGADDKTIRVWDAKTGKTLLGPLEGHSDMINYIAISPDGTCIASGSDDNTIRLWDAETGDSVMELKGHENWVRCIAFSPDGKRFVSSSHDKTIRIWDAKSGTIIGAPMEEHTDMVNTVVFSPVEQKIFSGSHDGTICVWDANTGRLLKSMHCHNDFIRSIACSPDGSMIVSGSYDKTIRLWDTGTGQPLTGPLQGHSDRVNSVAFALDGTVIASGSDDGTVCLWDVDKILASYKAGDGSGSTFSVSFSSDGKTVMSGSDDKVIRTWDSQTGELKAQTPGGNGHIVHSIAMSLDHRNIVVGSHEMIHVWDVQEGRFATEPLGGHSGCVRAIAFSADATQFASGSEDMTIRIWTVQTGNSTMTLRGHTSPVVSIAFSSDNLRIASGSDTEVFIWSARTGDIVAGPLVGQSGISAIAFSPDGSRIVHGADDNMLHVRSAQDGNPLLRPLMGHDGPISSLAFSSNGTKIVSGSSDHTVRVWNADNGEPVFGPFHGHHHVIRSVTFSPDGGRVASCSGKETIRIWDLVDAARPYDDSVRTNRLPVLNLKYVSLPKESGWVKGSRGELVMWIPPEYRPYLQLPPCRVLIDETKVTADFSACGDAYGMGWMGCFKGKTS
ncbi:WD40 repeat-like protein [Armillaria gallica]|uniref:WD40 repeat-like protein n=1 Tax=Armillaria gallica TaxID=47427 RepID=A0A2H3EUD6_ARMGA|nr:WD40 repeat-like protein [Armillaria gallica]